MVGRSESPSMASAEPEAALDPANKGEDQ